jgi:hypothetical protein
MGVPNEAPLEREQRSRVPRKSRSLGAGEGSASPFRLSVGAGSYVHSRRVENSQLLYRTATTSR